MRPPKRGQVRMACARIRTHTHTHTKSHAHAQSFPRAISMNEIWELAHYDVTFLELELEFLESPSVTISYSGFNTE